MPIPAHRGRRSRGRRGHGAPARRHRPGAGQRHRGPGHGQGGDRRPRRRGRDVTIALTTAGCPLRAQIQRDIRARIGSLPGGHLGAPRLDRAERRGEVGGHGQGPLERPREGAGHGHPPDRPGHHRRLGQGRRGQVVGDREPGRGPGRQGLHRRRARRRHLGLLGAPHARASRVASRAPPTAPRRSCPTSSAVGDGPAQGRVHGLPRRQRGGRPHVAGPHAQPGRAALPRGRGLGRPRLPADRHAARAPATCRWAWPACCPAPR